MTPDPIKTVVFSSRLQTEFAGLSGDWNPMHLSSLAARRTQVGLRAVHGIHTVLSMLDSLAASSLHLPFPSKISVRFLKPVYVNDSVAILQMDRNNKEIQLQGLVNGTTTTDVRVFSSDSHRPREDSNSLVTEDHVVCRNLSLTEMAGRSGAVCLATTPGKIRDYFPNAARWLGVERVGAMLCLSRLVGME